MKANINNADKAVRVILAVALAIPALTGILKGWLSIAMVVVAIVLLITVFINFCPIYHFLGISTKKKSVNPTTNEATDL